MHFPLLGAGRIVVYGPDQLLSVLFPRGSPHRKSFINFCKQRPDQLAHWLEFSRIHITFPIEHIAAHVDIFDSR